ncbi:hypothetical protein [uncultured Bradyrhizobium sp.]|nr:hypothetical protein [uncultured Bradyrhizobium sp.]
MSDSNPAEAKVMRAIIARHRKQALAERAEANAASAKQEVRGVGWSTKAPKKRKPSPLEKSIADDIALNRRRWAEKHPDRAAAERSLRKSRAEMHERWDHKAHGTPETHEHHKHHQDGALAQLYLSGSIDAEQLASAVEIATVAERIGADVTVRTSSVETRVDQTRSGDGTFYEALGAVRREMAYSRWRREVRGPIAAVLDMIVGETVGYTVVANRYGMHNRRAKRLLIDALDLWPQIFGTVCKDVDAATLIAAHAGILS